MAVSSWGDDECPEITDEELETWRRLFTIKKKAVELGKYKTGCGSLVATERAQKALARQQEDAAKKIAAGMKELDEEKKTLKLRCQTCALKEHNLEQEKTRIDQLKKQSQELKEKAQKDIRDNSVWRATIEATNKKAIHRMEVTFAKDKAALVSRIASGALQIVEKDSKLEEYKMIIDHLRAKNAAAVDGTHGTTPAPAAATSGSEPDTCPAHGCDPTTTKQVVKEKEIADVKVEETCDRYVLLAAC